MVSRIIGVLIGVALLFFVVSFFAGEDEVELDSKSSDAVVELDIVPGEVEDKKAVDFSKYNIDYMNDRVKGILVGRMGNARTDFYLPPTGYVNVTRGSKYGVAFVIQNVNPNVPEGNEFSFNVAVDPASVANCGVSVKEAQGWIERGWASTGMISGQWREDWNEWYDAMTIYFAFPSGVKACNIKYDFVITRDGVAYDSRVLEFNLI